MVSVIIINYNTFALTSACIRSVYAHTKGLEFEVVLVDNASTECDPKDFLAEFPQLRLVCSPENAGFAGGNNLGIQHAKGDYILLLNSDTELLENSVLKSYNAFLASASPGFLGCRMTYPQGQVQYTARRFRSIKWELLDLFRFIPYSHAYADRSVAMLGKYFRHDVSIECDWLNGAFLLFKRDLLDHFPNKKLDDRFFMYAEDQLWCEQAKEAGFRNYFYADTTIVHVNSGSSSIKRQLHNRQVMLKHELALVRRRKGAGLYYFFFALIYGAKEMGRNAVKWLLYYLFGKTLR